eukprot:1128355-Prorocentrum_lima.AAC.1
MTSSLVGSEMCIRDRTYSASGVLCETQVCRRLVAVIMERVCGPLTKKETPVVLRVVRTHPAKSASA